jgi:hypothetical protein
MAYTPNYTSRTITEESYNNKKHYDDKNIYTVFANNNFSIKVGSTKPIFVCFLKTRGEQFGDPIPAEFGDGQNIGIRIYDNSGGILVNGALNQTDTWLGEWTYIFSNLDFLEAGKFTGEILLIEGAAENVLGKFHINVYQ